MAIKKRAYEKLDNNNIQRVIDALNSKEPITKKVACEMLNISYNTTRLSKIIATYHEEKAYRQRRMDRNRGKPASDTEKNEMITMYLMGRPVSDIAKSLYRSSAFVKNFLDIVGVPTKVASGEQFIPPDECVKYEFDEGEWVWFNDSHPDAKGGKAGRIRREADSKRGREGGYKVYFIDYWVPVEWKEGMWMPWWPGIKRCRSWTVKPAYELATIQHLIDDYNINYESL
jgi:hypothetical protein